jgi:hypothetical protein
MVTWTDSGVVIVELNCVDQETSRDSQYASSFLILTLITPIYFCGGQFLAVKTGND